MITPFDVSVSGTGCVIPRHPILALGTLRGALKQAQVMVEEYLSPARALSFDILQLVESGGYAGDLLHSRAAVLDARDAALTHEIVFGVLRYRELDYFIGHYSGRPPAQAINARSCGRPSLFPGRYIPWML